MSPDERTDDRSLGRFRILAPRQPRLHTFGTQRQIILSGRAADERVRSPGTRNRKALSNSRVLLRCGWIVTETSATASCVVSRYRLEELTDVRGPQTFSLATSLTQGFRFEFVIALTTVRIRKMIHLTLIDGRGIVSLTLLAGTRSSGSRACFWNGPLGSQTVIRIVVC